MLMPLELPRELHGLRFSSAIAWGQSPKEEQALACLEALEAVYFHGKTSEKGDLENPPHVLLSNNKHRSGFLDPEKLKPWGNVREYLAAGVVGMFSRQELEQIGAVLGSPASTLFAADFARLANKPFVDGFRINSRSAKLVFNPVELIPSGTTLLQIEAMVAGCDDCDPARNAVFDRFPSAKFFSGIGALVCSPLGSGLDSKRIRPLVFRRLEEWDHQRACPLCRLGSKPLYQEEVWEEIKKETQ